MASVVTRSQAPWAFLPTLAKVYTEGLDKPSYYSPFVDMTDSSVSPDKRGVSTAFISGLGPLQGWGETNYVPFDTPDPGRTKTTAYLDIGVACGMSRNVMEDELHGVYKAIADSLPESHQLYRDLRIGQFLNNFFNTTYFTDDSPTAQAMGSISHASINGASRSNILADSSSLTYQAVIDLMTQMFEHTTEKGYQAPALEQGEQLLLVVSPADYPMALKICSELSQYEPDTTSLNNPNLVKQIANIKPYMTPYITATGVGNYWFILKTKKKPLWLVERRSAEIDTYMSPDNKAMIVDLTARECLHVSNDPKGGVWAIWASGNTNA